MQWSVARLKGKVYRTVVRPAIDSATKGQEARLEEVNEMRMLEDHLCYRPPRDGTSKVQRPRIKTYHISDGLLM